MLSLRPTIVRLMPILLSTLAACGGENLMLPGDTSHVEMVNGNGQAAGVGAQLPDPLIVRLVDASGNGIPNRTVVWVIQGGGGSVAPTSGMTDADGYASAEWTLGGEPGANSVAAQVPGVGEVTFTATAGDATAAASIEAVAGENQSAPAGTRVPVNPAVRVVDAAGDPVPGVRVTFAVTGGAGSVDGADQVSGADGVAQVGGWTLSSSPGTNTLEARAGSLQGSPVTFTAEGTSLEQLVNHLTFTVPPHDVDKGELFTIDVALADADGNTVPLSGIFIYLDLFPEGSDVPDNQWLKNEHFENTDETGVAEFTIRIEKEGRWRIRALTDDLPELGPHGPDPFLFSDLFTVR